MKMHYGNNGVAVCGESRLLVKSTTLDLPTTDCLGCLRMLWAQGLEAVDKVANRYVMVAEERIGASIELARERV